MASPAQRDLPPIDLGAYRAAVLDQVELIRQSTDRDGDEVVRSLLKRPEIAALLSALPSGMEGATSDLKREVHNYRPSVQSAANDLGGLIRIFLYSQIDVLWWGHVTPFSTDAEILGSGDLVDIEPLCHQGRLQVRYRRQPESSWQRLRASVLRRLGPRRSPHTAGVRFTQARPSVVAFLHQLSCSFAQTSAGRRSPPWVTSLARSVEHQHHLRSLGYSALMPSSHCVGYAADVEMEWFGTFGARETLSRLLLDAQRGDLVNVIDEGQAWHVCVNPAAVDRLNGEFDRELRS
jgi:hypothetical protein